jgi:SAM domain (Sterile alpha motif)
VLSPRPVPTTSSQSRLLFDLFLADWLDKLGMSEYLERFAENKIDVSVLHHITDQDLKDIGVPLGHRRKMLAAITELVGAAQGSAKTASTEVEAPRHCRAPPSYPQKPLAWPLVSRALGG